MKIPDYEFSEEEIRELGKYRDNQKDSRLKIRFVALLMPAMGSDANYAAPVIGKSGQTVGNRLGQYISEGTDSLNSFRYKPEKPCLNMYETHDVIIWAAFGNPRSIGEVVIYIKNRFGVTCCDEAVRKLLKKYGLKFIRPKKIPGNPPTPEEQKEFIRKYESGSRSCHTVYRCGAFH